MSTYGKNIPSRPLLTGVDLRLWVSLLTGSVVALLVALVVLG